MRKSTITRIPFGALATAICALASLGIPASAAATATPPTIESEWVTGVTQHNAVLHATINPNGTLTKYKLQFDESGTYHFYQADCGVLHVPGYAYCMHVTPGDERVEPPEGSIPAGNDPVEVSVNLASIGATLQPNTTYHYRAIAANGAPEIEGPDQTFTTSSATPPPTGPPTIESESVSNITPTDATLGATINPNGLETEYQFRVIQSPCHANPLTCEVPVNPLFPSTPGVIAAGSGGQPVSVDLESAGMTLEPGREYHYAVIATNEDGTEAGPDQTFTTPSPPSIISESASNITSTNAILEAQLNPGGAPPGAYFQFQIATDFGEYVEEIICPPEPSTGPFQPCIGAHDAGALPIGFVSAGSGSSAVSLDLASAGVTLQSGTTYHYRVLVAQAIQSEDTIEWEAPAALGADQTFTTSSLEVTPFDSQSSAGGDTPTSSAIQPPPSAATSSSNRSKHKRQRHRRKAHRATRHLARGLHLPG